VSDDRISLRTVMETIAAEIRAGAPRDLTEEERQLMEGAAHWPGATPPQIVHGIDGAPSLLQHLNCRCALIPVLEAV